MTIGYRPRLLVSTQPSLLAMPPRYLSSADLEWKDAIQLFLECWAADRPGVRPQTLAHYREQLHSRLAAFARERGIARVGDFGRYDMRAFVAWLDAYVTHRQTPLTQRGKQMALAIAKTFYRWLFQEHLTSEDVGAHVRSYRLDNDIEPRATPTDVLEELARSLDQSSATGIRNAAMIYLMALCGLRVSELVGLNLADLDLTNGRVRVRAGTSKGRRTRLVDLPLTIEDGGVVVKPEIAAVLSAWLRVRQQIAPGVDEEAPLFVAVGSVPPRRGRQSGDQPVRFTRRSGRRLTTDGVRCILDRAARKAGICSRLVMPHRLRHYFGLASAKAGVPITALMRAMGHTSTIMTARYSEFTDSERRWAFARADIAKEMEFPRIRKAAGETRALASSRTPIAGTRVE